MDHQPSVAHRGHCRIEVAAGRERVDRLGVDVVRQVGHGSMCRHIWIGVGLLGGSNRAQDGELSRLPRRFGHGARVGPLRPRIFYRIFYRTLRYEAFEGGSAVTCHVA